MQQPLFSQETRDRISTMAAQAGRLMIEFGLNEALRQRQNFVPPAAQPINGATETKLPFDPVTDCGWCYVAKVLAGAQAYLRRGEKHLGWNTGNANFFLNLARKELNLAQDITRQLDPTRQGEFTYLGNEIGRVKLDLLNPNVDGAFTSSFSRLEMIIDLAFAGAEGGQVRPPAVETPKPAGTHLEWGVYATPPANSSRGAAQPLMDGEPLVFTDESIARKEPKPNGHDDTQPDLDPGFRVGGTSLRDPSASQVG